VNNNNNSFAFSAFESRDSDGLDGPGSIPDRGKICLFSIRSTRASGPAQSLSKCVPAHQSPTSSVEVKNGGAMPPLPPYAFIVQRLVN
jgi:hypothetical protein